MDTSAQRLDSSSEISRYLQSPLGKLNENPLKIWEETRDLYPNLAKIAPRYLSVVATSVPSERLFSNAGQVLTQQRNRLKGHRLSKLLFLHSCESHFFFNV